MPPNYDPHTYVTFGGTLTEVAGQDEIWQCGIRGVNNPGGGPVAESELENLVTAIATQESATLNLLAWYQDTQSHIANNSRLQWVKAANIGPNGKYTGSPAVFMYPEPGQGAVAQSAPSFLSVCLTWTTAVKFGKKLRYGRVFPPNYGAQVTGGAVVAPASVLDLVVSAGNLLSAVAQSGDQFNFQPCVVSSEGGHSPISGVRVGNVYDVHRTRKDAVRETYSDNAWPS
jgi:hypothetical protein